VIFSEIGGTNNNGKDKNHKMKSGFTTYVITTMLCAFEDSYDLF
jgi:hypothetical protein